MVNTASHTSDQSLCSRCHSPLILIEEKTEFIDNNPHPITVSIYRCSNAVCQEARDKETQARLKARDEQNLARQAREQARQKSIISSRKSHKEKRLD